jgi:hypothetical protein
MRKPTPETISIMKTESGSTAISIPNLRSPADSHVHKVEKCSRSSGSSERRRTNTTAEQMNETSVAPAARSPA